MTAYTDDDVTAACDALDVAHETVYHVHASECCIELGKYVRAVLDAVAPAIAGRALREAADDLAGPLPKGEIALERAYEVPAWLRARAEQVSGAEEDGSTQ